MKKPITVNEFVSTEGVVYVAVAATIEALATGGMNASCIGCAFHDTDNPNKTTEECLSAPSCDGNTRYDGRTIHWEVKKEGGKK